jgi:hypothetical protein
MKRIFILAACVLLIFLPCLSHAQDFGLILDNSVGYGGFGTDGAFDYVGTLIPRFSSFLGDNGDIFVSAGIKADYRRETGVFFPELLRTELSWRFGSGEIKFGRMQYADPLGFIAEGLFDGALFYLDAGGGSLSLGAWYTGLLQKNRANITMTNSEQESSSANVDYDNFFNTYFAPRRVVSALGWEHPGLGELVRVRLAILGQFDVNRKDDPDEIRLHSQYLAGKIALPVRAFVFDAGGCLAAIQAGDDFNVALAGELGAAWMIPATCWWRASFDSRLSLVGRFSSGTVEDSPVTAFLPVTTVYQGDILKAKLSGLSMISLDYTARIHRTFSANIASSCFVRSDLATYSASYGDEGFFLGNEFFLRMLWSPVSDMRINLGAGVFLPSLGNAAPKAGSIWRAELNIILAVF